MKINKKAMSVIGTLLAVTLSLTGVYADNTSDLNKKSTDIKTRSHPLKRLLQTQKTNNRTPLPSLKGSITS